ncbi:STAS domain-containing protein [Nonomuraea dietziae]|uniref:STAS domain-containing protein n=1 Tax=Nonomuraea dietziae TaxID=65515 RepID=UPI0031E063D1
MKLRLARHAMGDAVVVAVEGELDLFTAPFLRDEVRDAIKQDGARLVLDLQALSFMDSSGLSVLIEGPGGWPRAKAAASRWPRPRLRSPASCAPPASTGG